MTDLMGRTRIWGARRDGDAIRDLAAEILGVHQL